MKKIYAILVAKKQILCAILSTFLILLSQATFAQPWNYDFGTGTGTFTSSTASTSFLPAPPSGTARVRVGTNPGSFSLVNSGLAVLGTDTELQMASNTGSTSTTKFSVYDYTPGKTGYVKFKIALAGGTNGVYKFSLGDGSGFSDNNAIATSNIFAGIEWTFGAANTITYRVLAASTYGTTGITGSTTLFSQSTTTAYEVEVYANNNTTSGSYLRGSTSYTIANGTWDLWIDGSRVGTGLARGGQGTNTNIDSYSFNHQNSASAPGTIYLDDIEYSNSLATSSIAISAAHPVAANITQSTNNNIVGGVQLSVSTAATNLTGVSLNTAGTYVAADIAANGFKLWLAPNATDLVGATQLGTAQPAVTSGGTVAVGSLSQSIASGTTRFILLTADVAASATPGNTIRLASTAFSNITFSTGSKTGTDPVDAGATPGNDQTIIAATTPTINTSGTLTGLTTTYGTASANTTFIVSGSALSANINITAPSGFEISTNASTGFGSSLALTPSAGAVSPTTIYVRLAAITPAGTYSGNISLTSTGAAAASIATASSVVNPKGLTITGLTGNNKVYDALLSATVTGTPALNGVITGDVVNLGGTGAFAFLTKTVGTGKTITASGYTISGAAAANYSLAQPTGLTGNITALGLTITGVSVSNKTYDGTVTATLTGGSLATVLSGDVVTLTRSGTFASPNAGTSIGVISTSTLGGADQANYTLTQPSGLSADILKANQAITFGALPLKVTSDPDFAPGATSPTSATNPITYASSNTAVATIVSGNIHIVGAGTSTITASQAASANYNAAADVTQLLTVSTGPCLNEGFNAGTTAPGGWTFSSGLSTYTSAGSFGISSPSISLNASAQSITTATITSATELSFWIKGQSTNATSALLIEGYVGSGWVTIQNLNNLPTTGTIKTYNFSTTPVLPAGVTQFRFTYTKSSGNLAFDDVKVFCAAGPEIDIKGNATSIANNDVTPATIDHTDFGNAAITGGTVLRTFTIENNGTADLNLTGTTPFVTISGANAADFTVTATPSSLITAGSSTTFNITFDPSGLGVRNAAISIANDDSDENPYTFSIRGSGTNSNLSVIADNTTPYSSATPEFNINTEYINFIDASATTAGKFIPMKFKIVDGPDADALPTVLNEIRFTVTDLAAANQLAQIKTAILTTSGGTVIATGAKLGNELVFTGLSGANFTAADDNEKIVHLRVSLDETQVIDQAKLIFKVTTALADAAGSTFADGDGGGAHTDDATGNGRNVLNVTATKLAFTTQPSGTAVNTNMTPSPVVSAVDIYNRKDININTGTVSVTSSGALDVSPQTATLTAGAATFGSVNHTAPGTGLVLTATHPTLGSAASTAFDITTAPNGSYRTLTAGTWPTSPTSTWERLVAGVWSASSAPSASVTDLLIIRHAITTSGAFAASGGVGTKMTVDAGGTFTASQNCTFNMLQVNTNGKFILQNPAVDIMPTGTVTVDSLGTLVINSSTFNHADGFFEGTENFKRKSIVEIQNYDYDSGPGDDDLIDTRSSSLISTNTAGYYFGNLFINGISLTSKAWSLVGVLGTHKLCENDLTVFNAATSTKSVLLTNLNANVEIGGNLILQNGAFSFGQSTSANLVQTINGDLLLSGATVVADINQGNSSAGANVVNLKGNLIGTAGQLKCTDISDWPASRLNFAGTAIQHIDLAAAVTMNNLAMYVTSGSSVALFNNNLLLNNNSAFNVSAGGLFDFSWTAGNVPLVIKDGNTGTNTFLSEAASTLKISSAEGLYKNWDSYTGITVNIGNVQGIPKSNRTISPTATFWFTGKTNQVTGDCINPSAVSTSDGKVVICDLANNTLTLTPTLSFGVTNAITVSPTGGKVDIRSGQFTETTSAYVFGSDGTLHMSPGTLYKIVKGNSSAASSNANSEYIPRMSGSGAFPYVLTGGTIELAGTGTNDAFQTFRGSSVWTYKNVKFSGANTFNTDYKNLSAQATIDSTLTITNNTVLDCRIFNGNAVSFVGEGSITMNSGRLRLKSTSAAQPQLFGRHTTYNLTGGVIEYYNSGTVSNSTIRGKDSTGNAILYQNIEVTGDKVGNSLSSITLRDLGTFIVKPTGIFEINDNSITGPAGTQTITIEGGGIFKTGNNKGFHGFTTAGSDNSSIHSNIENILLNDNSTVNYTRNGAQPITNTPDINYFHLTLSGDGHKDAPAGVLKVKGNLTGLGIAEFIHHDGSVLLNGGGQVYTATALYPFEFYNLTNAGTVAGGGLSVNSNMGIANELLLNSGSRTNLSAGDISIRSGLSKTARIGIVPSETGIIQYGTGRFIVERFINTGGTHGKSWQFLATPAKGETIYNTWQESGLAPAGKGIWLTSPSGTGFDNTSATTSIKTYDPSNTLGWTGKVSTDKLTTGLLEEPKGYMVFVRGDRNARTAGDPATPTVLRSRGRIYAPGADAPGSVTAPAGEVISLGNPYASAISLGRMFTGSANIEENYYVWDPSLFGSYNAGGYQTIFGDAGYIVTPGSSIYSALAYPEIQSGQAFFARSISTDAGTVNFSEGLKETGSILVNRGGGAPVRATELNMISTFLYTKTGLLADGNRVIFDSRYTDAVNEKDAKKVINAGENFGLLRHDKKLVVEGRGLITRNDTLFYNMSNLKQLSYKLLFAVQNIPDPALLKAELIDQFLGKRTPVSLTDTSLVEFEVTADAASKAANRFMLVLRSVAGPLPVTITNVSAGRNADRSIAVSWTVANEVNIEKYVVERSAGGTAFAGIITTAAANRPSYLQNDLSPLAADNYYRIKAISNNGQVQYSNIVKVAPLSTTASVNVYPNPVVDKKISLRFTNEPKGIYAVTVSNNLGQVVYKGSVMLNAAGYVKTIDLGKNAASGTYQLQVNKTNGEIMTIRVVVE